MFPSHMSVNDLGVFAVVMVFGLLVVLLFMFDFVSMTILNILHCDHNLGECARLLREFFSF